MTHLHNDPSPNKRLIQYMRSSTAWIRYRRKLRNEIARMLPPRMLTVLADLPLPISDTMAVTGQGAIHWLRSVDLVALCERSRMPLTIIGPPGAGRFIALAQIAWRWAQSGHGIPPLLIDLSLGDHLKRSPYERVCAALAEAGEDLSTVSGLIETRRPWLLLLAGWDALALQDQEQWHDFLLALPRIWPDAQMLLALPDEQTQQQLFPNTMPLVVRAPDDALVERMLTVLLPHTERGPLLEALAADKPLAPVRERTLDLVLLAWRFQEQGLPTSRGALWSWAIAHNRIDKSQFGGPWLGEHILMRLYRHARELANAAQWVDTFGALPLQRQADLAPFLADLLSNPAPLFEALWSDPAPNLDRLLLLGRCLLAWWATHQTTGLGDGEADWVLRIVSALTDYSDQSVVVALLERLQPPLHRVIATTSALPVQHELVTIAARLPEEAREALLLDLIEATTFEPAARWAAADQIAEHGISPTLRAQLIGPFMPDARSGAVRGYLVALAGPEWVDALTYPAVPEWVIALKDDLSAGVDRQKRAADALLAASDLPPKVRAAATVLFSVASVQPIELPSTLLSLAVNEPLPVPTLLSLAVNESPSAPSLRARAVNEPPFVPILPVAVPPPPALAPAVTLQQLARDLIHSVSPEQQRASLVAIGVNPAPEASLLLTRCTLTEHLPVWVRLQAVTLLATRRGAPVLLRRLLRAPDAHELVRAHATRLLVATWGNGPPPVELEGLIEDATFPLARHEAVHALGHLGHSDASVALLTSLVVAPTDDLDLLEDAIIALGHQSGVTAIPWLAGWLGTGASARLHATWSELADQLPAPLVASWPHAPLSAARRRLLATAFAVCVTPADQPTTLHEFLEQRALRLSAAAAATIARIGDPIGRDALALALQTAPPALAPPLLNAIATLDPTGEVSIGLLDNHQITEQTRWLLMQHLPPEALAGGADRMLAATESDPFARGALVSALARGGTALLPALRRLVETIDEHPYVRESALAAIGQIGNVSAEAFLLAIVVDRAVSAKMRTAAANALPSPISLETSHRLQTMLQTEQTDLPLLVALLAALGRAHDLRALPMLLSCCDDAQSEVALAALQAIEQIGDATAVPTVANIAQSANAAPLVRLQAASAALRLGGERYVPLILPTLKTGMLPLQIQALELLVAVQPDSPVIAELLGDRTRALPVRRRAARALAGLPSSTTDDPDAPVILDAQQQALICQLLADPHEDDALRLLLADLLVATARSFKADTWTDAADALLATFSSLASDSTVSDGLRLRCVAGLGALGRVAAPTLCDLMIDSHTNEAVRSWATEYVYETELANR